MKTILQNKQECIGCGACVQICPVNAINMIEDEFGFIYPKINEEKCINCGLCKKKCPVLNKKEDTMVNKEEVYAYCTNNNRNWLNSTSGGAFLDICKIISNQYENVKIYGAAMNEQFDVKHIRITINEINKIQKSKYAQSNIGNTYAQAKQDLENDCYVIFSGTPCQIAGLLNYLDKSYEKLLCIDLICHGVSNTKILKQSIKLEQDKRNKIITNYYFRYKKNRHFIAKRRYNVQYEFEDGSKEVSDNDTFMNLFLSGKCLRTCCGCNCQFKASYGFSDITLADLNNKSKIIPKVYDQRNYSSIIFHNSKAIGLIDKLSKMGTCIKCEKQDVIKYNKMYYENAKYSNEAELFFESLKQKKPLEQLIEPKQRKNKSLSDSIPYFIKYIVNNLIKERKK